MNHRGQERSFATSVDLQALEAKSATFSNVQCTVFWLLLLAKALGYHLTVYRPIYSVEKHRVSAECEYVVLHVSRMLCPQRVYLNDLPYCTSVFFFVQECKLFNLTSSPANTCSPCESSSTTRCRSRSTGSGAEPMLDPTVSDKQTSELRLVIISRRRSNGKHPNSQAKVEPPPNSSQLPTFLDLFCPRMAAWLSYPGRSPVQTQGVCSVWPVFVRGRDNDTFIRL